MCPRLILGLLGFLSFPHLFLVPFDSSTWFLMALFCFAFHAFLCELALVFFPAGLGLSSRHGLP